MKTLLSPVLFILPAFTILAQNSPVPCSPQPAIKQAGVMELWEYKTDKKTKKRSFSSVQEFNENGCMVKQIRAGNTNDGSYGLTEWTYDDKGRLTGYKEGRIDADSARSYAFSETYGYNANGLFSQFRKDIYEGEMSQTAEKWEYSYSDKGERTGSSFTRILVRKDTISNDDIKYAGSGMPVERSVNTYYPKGISESKRYNAIGLPVEAIRYEKGKMVSHKIYSYQYSAQGILELETVVDGVGKTSEKKKYEKDKIVYTLMNTKGQVLKSSSEPLARPAGLPYPPLPASGPLSAEQTKIESDKTTAKEKQDKKNNKVVEHYSGAKLVYTDTFDPKGLLIEKNSADSGFVLVYEYTFY